MQTEVKVKSKAKAKAKAKVESSDDEDYKRRELQVPAPAGAICHVCLSLATHLCSKAAGGCGKPMCADHGTDCEYGTGAGTTADPCLATNICHPCSDSNEAKEKAATPKPEMKKKAEKVILPLLTRCCCLRLLNFLLLSVSHY